MTGPAWLTALLAAVMLLIAVGSAARLARWRLRGRPAEPEADVLHVAMGVAMAGMLEPGIGPVPATAWLCVFTAAAAWFAFRTLGTLGHRAVRDQRPERATWRCAHPGPHSVECVAMVYMFVQARGGGSHGGAMAMPGMTGAGANPAVVLVLALFLLGYIVWTADRLASQRRRRPVGPALAPPEAVCSKIAMSLAMGYMLLAML
jgi:hypothetical protein